jgi:hypothetical protein
VELEKLLPGCLALAHAMSRPRPTLPTEGAGMNNNSRVKIQTRSEYGTLVLVMTGIVDLAGIREVRHAMFRGLVTDNIERVLSDFSKAEVKLSEEDWTAISQQSSSPHAVRVGRRGVTASFSTARATSGSRSPIPKRPTNGRKFGGCRDRGNPESVRVGVSERHSDPALLGVSDGIKRQRDLQSLIG